MTFAGLGEAADRTETGKIEIAKMSPNNAITRCLGEFIRLQCKGYAFIQLELHAQTRIWRIFLGSTGCQPVSFRQLAEKPTTQLMLRFVKMSSASCLGAPEFALAKIADCEALIAEVSGRFLSFFKTDKRAAMRTRFLFPIVIASTLICISLSSGQEGSVPAVPARHHPTRCCIPLTI